MNEDKNKTPEFSPQDFTKALGELSDKMGYQLNYSPHFFQQDNGSFSIKIVVNVIKKEKGGSNGSL